jgi:hypothetical protein
MSKPTNCMDCPFHKVIPDPDPHDWFNDDDEAVVCLKMNNDSMDLDSKYAADRQAFKKISVACRPYNKRRECETPKWCPL